MRINNSTEWRMIYLYFTFKYFMVFPPKKKTNKTMEKTPMICCNSFDNYLIFILGNCFASHLLETDDIKNIACKFFGIEDNGPGINVAHKLINEYCTTVFVTSLFENYNLNNSPQASSCWPIRIYEWILIVKIKYCLWEIKLVS